MVERILRRLDRLIPPPLALAVASIGATVAAVAVATTLLPNGPVVPMWTVVPLFAGLFPVHLRSVRLLPSDQDLKSRVLAAPRSLLVVAAVAGAVAFPLVMHGIFTIQGQPKRHGGSYYADKHGELIRLSRSQYRYEQRLEQRIFAGGALLFYMLSVLINAGESKLSESAESRGRPSTSPGPASAR